MDKLPTVCALLEFLTCKLGTIISYQGFWHAISAELLFHKLESQHLMCSLVTSLP